MGQGKDEKRKGSALGTAAVATASVALGYAALELGLGGVLRPGRDAIKESLQPQDDAAARQQQQRPELVTEADHDNATTPALTTSSATEVLEDKHH